MSVFGGGAQVQADLIEAIRGLSRTLSEAGSQARGTQSAIAGFQPGNIGAAAGGAIGGPLGAAAGEMLGNNVFVNAAMKAGRDFTNDVFNNVAGDFAKYGSNFGGSFSESVTQGSIRAAANIPFFGDVAQQVVDIQGNARSRLKGLIDPAARGGAKFTDEELKPVAEFFQAEEGRANAASQQIDKLFKKEELVGQASDAVPRFGEMVDALARVQQTAEALSTTFAGLTSAVQMATGGQR